jgi:hypothetical protein
LNAKKREDLILTEGIIRVMKRERNIPVVIHGKPRWKCAESIHFARMVKNAGISVMMRKIKI